MNLLETMRQALEALEECYFDEVNAKAIANLHIAIAEIERDEPVGRFVHQDFGGWQQVAKEFEHHTDTTPLFAHPQDRDSIIEECAVACEGFDERYRYNYGATFADAIRAMKGKK